MVKEEEENEWQQYFPSYKFKKRDIALEEYRSSSARVLADEKMFYEAIKILTLVATFIGSLGFVGKSKYLPLDDQDLIVLSAFVCLLSYFILKYFADRHKTVVMETRKIVVLRRMLDMNYGTLQLVMPTYRIEGANTPFAIRLFPGWLIFEKTFPFWLIALSSSLILYKTSEIFLINQPFFTIFVVSIWFAFLGFIYRRSLLDTHENIYLLFVKRIAWFIGIEMEKNFEWVIYRAKLAMFDSQRLKIDIDKIEPILLYVEDRSFFKHHGYSPKSIFRALLGLVGLKRKSGGSTLTQQLVRTLFIVDLHKRIRRKIMEILLAIWFEKFISKKEMIAIYLAAVRFEKGVHGIAAAIKYFLDKHPSKPLSNAEIFFLIERISNINSKILFEKITHSLKQLQNQDLLSKEEIGQTILLYEKMLKKEKLNDTDNRIKDWIAG